jgi:hypothetical protein
MTAVPDLSQLVSDLKAQYPRAAHRGRLEQIEAVAGNLQSLMDQLPGEEEREAEYEQRLLEMHGTGKISLESPPDGADPAGPEVAARSHPQAAIERLADALARKGA